MATLQATQALNHQQNREDISILTSAIKEVRDLD